jgi:hypothetical protein
MEPETLQQSGNKKAGKTPAFRPSGSLAISISR